MTPVRGSGTQVIGSNGGSCTSSGTRRAKLPTAPARKTSPPIASVAVTPTNVEITSSRLSGTLSGSLLTEVQADQTSSSTCQQKRVTSPTVRERGRPAEVVRSLAVVKERDVNGAVFKSPRSRHVTSVSASSSSYSSLRSRVLRTLAAMKEGMGRDSGSTVGPSTRNNSPSSSSAKYPTPKGAGNRGTTRAKEPSGEVPLAKRKQSAPLQIHLPSCTLHAAASHAPNPPPMLSPALSSASLDSLSSSPSPRSLLSQESELKILEKAFTKFTNKQKNRGEILRNVVAKIVCDEGSTTVAYPSAQALMDICDVLLRWWAVLLSGLPTVPCGDRGVYFDCILGIMERREFDDFDYLSPPGPISGLPHTPSTTSIATTASAASMTVVDSDETKGIPHGCDAADSNGESSTNDGDRNFLQSSESSNEHVADRSIQNNRASAHTGLHIESSLASGLTALKMTPDVTENDPVHPSNICAATQKTACGTPSTRGTMSHRAKLSKRKLGKTLKRKSSLFNLVAFGAMTVSKQHYEATSEDLTLCEHALESSPWRPTLGQQNLRGMKYGSSSWSLHALSDNDSGKNGFFPKFDTTVSRYRHLLVDTLDYSINRLDQKGVFANVVTWSGRILALSFLKIPGVAACLLQALPLSAENVEAFVYGMAGASRTPSADALLALERVIPAHLAPYVYRHLGSWCALFDRSHKSPDIPVEEKISRTFEDDDLTMTAELIVHRTQYGELNDSDSSSCQETWVWRTWNRKDKPLRIAGNWVRRWQSDDSDLFHSFYQCYSRLLAAKLHRLRSLMAKSQFNGLAPHLVLALPGHAHVAGYVLGRAEALVLRRETMTVTQQTNGQGTGECVPPQNCVLLENHSRRLAATMKTVECALGYFCPDDIATYTTSLAAVDNPGVVSTIAAGGGSHDEHGDQDRLSTGVKSMSPNLAQSSYKARGNDMCGRGFSLFGKSRFHRTITVTRYPLGVMDVWVRHVLQKTNVHDVMSVFGLLDFLESMASVYVDRKLRLLGSYEGYIIPTTPAYVSPFHMGEIWHPQPVLDNAYVVSALKVLLSSEHSMVLLRTLHFIFRQFGRVVAVPASSSSSTSGAVLTDGSLLMYPGVLNSGIYQLCMDLLLDPPLFERLFCHWHRGVRNAFHRICVWRIGRLEERSALVSEPSEMVPTGKGGFVGFSAANSADDGRTAPDASDSGPSSPSEAVVNAGNDEHSTICREKMTVPFPLLRIRNVHHREILLTLEARLRDARLSHEHHVTARTRRSRAKETIIRRLNISPVASNSESCSAPTVTSTLKHCASEPSTSSPKDRSIISAPRSKANSPSGPVREKNIFTWMFPSSGQGSIDTSTSDRLAVSSTLAPPGAGMTALPAANLVMTPDRSSSLMISDTPFTSAETGGSALPVAEGSELKSPERTSSMGIGSKEFTRNGNSVTSKTMISNISLGSCGLEGPTSGSPCPSGTSVTSPACAASRLYPERMDVYAERSLEEYDQGFLDYISWISHMLDTYPPFRDPSFSSSPSAVSSTPSTPTMASPRVDNEETSAGTCSCNGNACFSASTSSPTLTFPFSAVATASTVHSSLSSLGRKSSTPVGKSCSPERGENSLRVIGRFPPDTEPRWLDMDEAWGGRWAFVNNAAINGGWARNALPDAEGVKSL